MTRKAFLQIGLLCLLGCSLISCFHQPQEVATIKDGRTFEEQGNYVGALNNYQRMPDPGVRETCTHNLQTLYGEMLNAMLAQQKNPNSAETFYALGKAYYDKAQTIPEYPEIVPNQNFDSATYFAEQQAQFYAKAQTTVESATRLQPDYQDALLLKGNIYEETEKPEEAIPAYQQLVALQTNSPEAFSRLGALLYNRGQIEDGLQLTQQAIDKAPDNSEAHFALGMLYAREEADDNALAEFQQALCHNLQYQEAYYKIAHIYLRQDNLLDAERVLRLGVINNPQSLQLALFYRSLKAVADVREEAEVRNASRQLVAITRRAQLATATPSTDLDPELQVLDQRLKLNILLRQRSYTLPCAGMEESPAITKQIETFQKKIAHLEQTIQSEKESAQAEAQTTQPQK
jgi:tetratricopeptide (TPR) repeat protein